jgi:hypothetical protein
MMLYETSDGKRHTLQSHLQTQVEKPYEHASDFEDIFGANPIPMVCLSSLGKLFCFMSRWFHFCHKYFDIKRRLDRLTTNEVINELPPNYEELKKSANRSSNWKERLDAVEQLGQWNHKKVIDVLTTRLMTDPVYQVQEAAFHKLQAFGQEVQQPSKNKGELIKGVTKILIRIKKSLPKEHTFEEFKEKLQKMREDVYDTYEGDKGEDFNAWLESTWESLSTR